MKVAIDDLDLRIIEIFDGLKPDDEITIYEIAMRVFPGAKSLIQKRKDASKVTYRIERMEDLGIIRRTYKSYDLIEKNCWFAPVDLPHASMSGERMTIKRALFINSARGKLIMQVM